MSRGSTIDMFAGGVYAIRCMPEKRDYFGAAAKLYCRLATHVGDLQAGKHSNRELQAHWNHYGPAAFQFRIVRLLSDPKERLELEAELIRNSRPYLPYNVQGRRATLPTMHARGIEPQPTARPRGRK